MGVIALVIAAWPIFVPPAAPAPAPPRAPAPRAHHEVLEILCDDGGFYVVDGVCEGACDCPPPSPPSEPEVALPARPDFNAEIIAALDDL